MTNTMMCAILSALIANTGDTSFECGEIAYNLNHDKDYEKLSPITTHEVIKAITSLINGLAKSESDESLTATKFENAVLAEKLYKTLKYNSSELVTLTDIQNKYNITISKAYYILEILVNTDRMKKHYTAKVGNLTVPLDRIHYEII